MGSDRATARIAGVMFIIATVAAIIGGSLLLPALGTDYLTKAAASEGRVVAGAVFELIQAITVVGIAVVLFPALRRRNERLALGYVGARTLEGVFVTAGALSAVLLLHLSQTFGSDGPASSIDPVGQVLRGARDWTYWIGPMAFFSVSALILYTVLYQSALVPRWLSGWGFAGGVLLLISAVLAMFGADLGAAQAVFSAPIGFNEMVLAIWLIAKGFNPPVPETMREEASVARSTPVTAQTR
jgi:Domain of unknown function (DUF4386)